MPGRGLPSSFNHSYVALRNILNVFFPAGNRFGSFVFCLLCQLCKITWWNDKKDLDRRQFWHKLGSGSSEQCHIFHYFSLSRIANTGRLGNGLDQDAVHNTRPDEKVTACFAACFTVTVTSLGCDSARTKSVVGSWTAWKCQERDGIRNRADCFTRLERKT